VLNITENLVYPLVVQYFKETFSRENIDCYILLLLRFFQIIPLKDMIYEKFIFTTKIENLHPPPPPDKPDKPFSRSFSGICGNGLAGKGPYLLGGGGGGGG
jgi:hypothetical protein